MRTGLMEDAYRVLPHRDVDVNCKFAGAAPTYEHRPCGMPLKESDVKEANWCPHCAAVINKAARRRGQGAIAARAQHNPGKADDRL